MSHPCTLFWLRQSEKLDNLSTAEGQMAKEVLNAIPNIAAKAYHIISVWLQGSMMKSVLVGNMLTWVIHTHFLASGREKS